MHPVNAQFSPARTRFCVTLVLYCIFYLLRFSECTNVSNYQIWFSYRFTWHNDNCPVLSINFRPSLLTNRFYTLGIFALSTVDYTSIVFYCYRLIRIERTFKEPRKFLILYCIRLAWFTINLRIIGVFQSVREYISNLDIVERTA